MSETHDNDTGSASDSLARQFVSSGDKGSEVDTREVEKPSQQSHDPNQNVQPKSGAASPEAGVFRVVVDSRSPGSLADTAIIPGEKGSTPDEFDTGLKVPVDGKLPGSDQPTAAMTRSELQAAMNENKPKADAFDDLETREVPALSDEWRDRAAKAAEALGETAEVVGAWEEDQGDDSLAHSVAVASGAYPLPEEERPAAVAGSALEKAREAQRQWAALRFEQRMERFNALRHELVLQRADYVPSMATAIGRPMVETLAGEYIPVLEALRTLEDIIPPLLVDWHAGNAPICAEGVAASVRMVPWGIVAIINPPGAPFALPMTLAIDALATGNAVMICGSDQHPRVNETMRKMFQRAGFPEALAQVVSGSAETVLATIDARPDMLVHMGDQDTAAKLASRCVQSAVEFRHIRGAKNMLVVLPDAPLERAVHAAMWGAYASGGMLPGSVERVVVAAPIFDEFRMRFIESLRAMNSHHAQLATINETFNARRFQALVDDAVSLGARVSWPAGEVPGRWIHWKAAVFESLPDRAKASSERLEGPGVILYRAEDVLTEVQRLLKVAPAGHVGVLGKPGRELRAQLEQLPVSRLLIQETAPHGAGANWPLGPEMPRTLCGPAAMLRPRVISEGDPVAGRVAWFPYTDDKAYALMEAIEAEYGAETGKRLKAALRLALNASKRRLLRGDNS